MQFQMSSFRLDFLHRTYVIRFENPRVEVDSLAWQKVNGKAVSCKLHRAGLILEIK
jgi:hypothetical protein